MEYRLSATLRGHDKDVLNVICLEPSRIISCSRDSSVRAWHSLDSSPPSYENIMLEERSKPKIHVRGEQVDVNARSPAYVQTVAYISPSPKYPDGLIAAGGEDDSIQIMSPYRVLGEPAEAELKTGVHRRILRKDNPKAGEKKGDIKEIEGKYLDLAASEDGQYLASANTDGNARIWEVGTWKLVRSFEDHHTPVWAVIWIDKETIATAAVDGKIRLFNISGQLINTITASAHALRALCKLPQDHPSGAQFASGDYQGNISLWDVKGAEIGQLIGHRDTIFRLAALSKGRIVSGSEDHTAKIWDGTECVQSITHPALSVLSVAAFANGDIITCTSKPFLICIFSTAQERQDPIAMQEFTTAVKNYKWPVITGEDDDASKLRSSDSLVPPRSEGTRDGDIKRVRQRDGKIFVFGWAPKTRKWLLLGEDVGETSGEDLVEDAAEDMAFNSRTRKVYQGKEYDEVWDIAVGEGRPSLKLAMNYSQTAEQAADAFLAEHPDLNVTSNRVDIIAFIESNTRGNKLGTPAVAKTPFAISYLPLFEIGSTVLPKLENKILEFNITLNQTGFEKISLNRFLKTSSLEGHPWNGNADADGAVKDFLDVTLEQLATSPPNASLLPSATIDVVLHMCKNWPQNLRFPALNLLGNLAAFYCPALLQHTASESTNLIDFLFDADIFALKAPPSNILMTTRALANLFNTDDGIAVVGPSFDRLHSRLGPFVALAASNPNLGAALTTLYCNYAVLLHVQHDPGRGLQILEVVTHILYGLLPGIDDGPQTLQAAIYRGTTALKAVLALDVEELRRAARGVLEITPLLRKMEGKGGTDLQALKDEVAELLWKT